MYSKQSDNNMESIVIPLYETVVYPKSRTKLLANKITGEILLNQMKNAEFTHAIGLTVKSGVKATELSKDDLYKTGNLLKITLVQPSDNGYLVVARSLHRVKVVSLRQTDGTIYAVYEPASDLPDLDEDMHAEILEDVKKTIHEISSRFQGSEQFTKPIDKMDSIDQIMGYIIPYMPIKLEEKQNLLEITSIRERYLTFLYILTKQKDNINLQIEVAKKVTDKINKSNREAMLREQLKVIQEELGGGDDSASGDGYHERIENSKMPDDVRKKH